MGLSNNQFIILLSVLIGIVIWGGIVFQIADAYGKVWAVLAMNIVNIAFFISIIFMYRRNQNVIKK